MAKRDLNWSQDTEILREDAIPPQKKERAKHRLTVEIYEDQFMAMELRKAKREAGTVTDQIREAIDSYLKSLEP